MSSMRTLKVSLNVPFVGKIEGTWEPDEREKEAAWEMYVELITRISIEELKPNEGLMREALTSLYSLFQTTRDILRKYGPSVAKPKITDNNLSFGYLAVAMLNCVLRPVLAKWHPLLLCYEAIKEPGVSPILHEKRWDSISELHKVLNSVRINLIDYAKLLSIVSGVPLFIV